jgi:paraquat-inducible protein B
VSSKANKSLIGLFVLGALALALAAIVVFGSGMFFTERYKAIMFFDNSVSGLSIGAPVLFRGVPIGAVTSIGVDADPAHLTFSIPVVIEILGGKIMVKDQGGPSETKALSQVRKVPPETFLAELITKGLKAQLVTQSLVTGQMAVSLDFFPERPIKLLGSNKFQEIPTVPSEFDELAQTLKSLPLQELITRLIGAVTGIEKFVNSPYMEKAPRQFSEALAEGAGMISETRAKLGPIMKELDQAVQSYNTLAKNADIRLERLSATADKSLDAVNAALKETRTVLGRADKLLSSDSPTLTELNKAMGEIAAAARSIRILADYLERHPEALIQGKANNRR